MSDFACVVVGERIPSTQSITNGRYKTAKQIRLTLVIVANSQRASLLRARMLPNRTWNKSTLLSFTEIMSTPSAVKSNKKPLNLYLL